MSGNSQDTDLNGAHIKRAGTLQKFKWGGVQEFQHRAAAHHRDVHDPHAPLHRPQRL